MPPVFHAQIYQQLMHITLQQATALGQAIVLGYVIQAISKTELFVLYAAQLLAELVSTGQLAQQGLFQTPHALLAQIMESLIYLTPLQAQELELVIAHGNVLQTISSTLVFALSVHNTLAVLQALLLSQFAHLWQITTDHLETLPALVLRIVQVYQDPQC